MTISNPNNVAILQGNDLTTVFPFSFEVPDASNMFVRILDAATNAILETLVPGTYTVIGFGVPTGGSVTYPLVGPPLASNRKLMIERILAYTQDMDIQNEGGFYPEVIEDQMDRIVMQIQQIAERLSRTPQGNPGQTIPPIGVVGEQLMSANTIPEVFTTLSAGTAGVQIFDKETPNDVKVYLSLDAVDNTSDLAKPISTATQAALDAHTTNTSNPHDVTKAQVGLGNADNTSDANKPISTATQTALNAKADQSALTAHVTDLANPHGVTKAQVGLGNVDNTSDANKPISTATQTALNAKEATVNKGIANGYASLGADGKVPSAQLPVSGAYKGTWNASTNTPTITSGVGVNGDFYIVSVAGTTNIDGVNSWAVGDQIRFNGTVWEKIPNSQAVSSVNGYTGAVVLVKADVGLGNVDNTSDLNKPISTATQTALNGKQDSLGFTPVNKAGDTFTGDVTINKAIPRLKLSKTASGQGTELTGENAGSPRWRLNMGNSTAESGSNAGSDFQLQSFTDAGTFLSNILTVTRSTGLTAFGGPISFGGDILSNVNINGFRPYISGAAGTTRAMEFRTGTSPRFIPHVTSDAESGSDVGSNFRLNSFTDAGAFKATVLEVIRSTGEVKLGTSAQNATALGGFKWTKGISLAAATDANTLTESSIVDGTSMTNMPYGSSGRWLVLVDALSTGTNDISQRAKRVALPTTYPSGEWWHRTRQTGVWSDWQPMGGFVTPEHYAAGADGVVDDTSAVASAVRSGFPVLLRRLYRITSQVTCGVGINTAGDGTVAIYGMGGKHIYLDGTQASFTFTAGTTSGTFGAPQFIMKDVIMNCPRTDHTRGAITINGTGGSGSVSKNFDIHNVQVFGTSNSTSTLYGFVFNNARNGHIKNCVFQGKRSEAAGSRTTKGIIILGDSDPVAHRIEACNIYFVSRAVEITGTPEGIQILDPEFVAVDYGVDWVSDENPISGDNSGKQMLIVHGGHINFVVYGVRVLRGWDWQVTNVTFLFSVANSNGICIYGEMQASNDQQAWIEGCKFQDKTTGAVSSGTTVGISLQGHTSGVLRSRIGINWYVLLTHGIFLGTNAKEVRWEDAGVFTACTNAVTNTGGGTNTAY